MNEDAIGTEKTAGHLQHVKSRRSPLQWRVTMHAVSRHQFEKTWRRERLRPWTYTLSAGPCGLQRCIGVDLTGCPRQSGIRHQRSETDAGARLGRCKKTFR